MWPPSSNKDGVSLVLIFRKPMSSLSSDSIQYECCGTHSGWRLMAFAMWTRDINQSENSDSGLPENELLKPFTSCGMAVINCHSLCPSNGETGLKVTMLC